MGGFLNRLTLWWARADRVQRTMIVGGSAALLFLVFLALMFGLRPHYETLYSGLTEQEQSDVATQLQGMGFDVKYDRSGVIEVPSSEKASARMRLASVNKQPQQAGQWGLSNLDSMPFGVTPSVEQERLKAIKEGEIAKSIETMDGVQSARVHLTLPAQSAFVEEQRPATASISIVESSEGIITNAQGRAIALLVRNAVDGLDMKDIVVVNQHLRTIWNGEDEQDEGAGGAERKTDMDEAISTKRQHELQSVLDGAFGPGAAIVTVHADVDMDPTKTDTVERTPAGTSAQESHIETVSGSAKPPAGGPAGVSGNTGAPAAVTGTGGTAGSYNGQTITKENEFNETHVVSSHAIGSIKGMAINVVVDSARVSDPNAVQSVVLGDLGDKVKLNAATGQPEPNQPFSVKVTPVEFDKTAQKEEVAAEKAAASQERIQQLISMLPIAALLLVAGMVLRQIAKFARSQSALSSLTGPKSLELEMPSSSASLPDGGTLSNLLAQIQASETSGGGGMGGGGGITFTGPRYEEPAIEVEDIKNRVHIPLEQLKKMAHERPALVAMLIKSMLLEERK